LTKKKKSDTRDASVNQSRATEGKPGWNEKGTGKKDPKGGKGVFSSFYRAGKVLERRPWT